MTLLLLIAKNAKLALTIGRTKICTALRKAQRHLIFQLRYACQKKNQPPQLCHNLARKGRAASGHAMQQPYCTRQHINNKTVHTNKKQRADPSLQQRACEKNLFFQRISICFHGEHFTFDAGQANKNTILRNPEPSTLFSLSLGQFGLLAGKSEYICVALVSRRSGPTERCSCRAAQCQEH